MHIKYPSRTTVKEIRSASSSKIIKEIADGHLQSATDDMLHSATFKECFEVSLTKIVQQETQQLTSRKKPSILSKTDSESLLTFSDKKFVDEIRERAPTVYSVLHAISTSKRQARNVTKGLKPDRSLQAISMACSVLLKSHCNTLSAQAYRVGFILHHSGAKKLVSCLHNFLSYN